MYILAKKLPNDGDETVQAKELVPKGWEPFILTVCGYQKPPVIGPPEAKRTMCEALERLHELEPGKWPLFTEVHDK